jgi:hypothetical protein
VAWDEAKKGTIDPLYGTTLDDYFAKSQSTDFSQFERQLAEAQYLVGLAPDPLDAGTVILTDSRLLHTGAEQTTPSPNTQWLSWTSQRRGKPDESAPAVRWLKLDWKDDTWSPFPILSQPNPVYMLTCRVDFAFPDNNTITASLTEEASDEISWVWEGWVGAIPVGQWEWPVATWYDANGVVQEIRRGHDTESSVVATGTCRSTTWPPDWYDPVTGTNPWTSSGTCLRVLTQGAYWYTFLGQELRCVVSEGETTETLYPPSWTQLPGLLFQNYDVPRSDYTQRVRIGGNVLWRQLRADAAFFVQRSRSEQYYHYKERYAAWLVTPWPAQYTYFSVLPFQSVEVMAAASAWAVAGNEAFQMTDEQVLEYVDLLDAIGPDPAGVFYTSAGWLVAANLWTQLTQSTDPSMEWIRISYDGQKIVRDHVWNPIGLSTDDIVTFPFLADCFEKSIWVGAS